MYIVVLFLTAQPIMAESTYGTIAQTGDTYEVQISNSTLANKEVAFLIYNLQGDINQIDFQYIGCIY